MRMRRAYFLACAVLMGASFTAGLVWAICAITVMHDKNHVVAGVGLLGVSAVAGVWSSLTFALWGPRETTPVAIHVRPRRETPDVTLELGDAAVVSVATSADSPPKIVVFEPTAD